MDRLISSIDAMKEGTDKGYSVFEMLEQETGIELTLDGVKSYHEFPFLAETDQVIRTDYQEARMLEEEIQWIPSVMLAGICLVLHRKDRWGFDRLSKFMDKVNILRNILGENEERTSDYMYSVTGHRAEELWRE